MISRKTTLLIAEFVSSEFTGSSDRTDFMGGRIYETKTQWLYEFLFERNFPAYFCNLARTPSSPKGTKDWFLKLHTGESLVDATKNWSWEQREKLGQEHLKCLAEYLIKWEKEYTYSKAAFEKKKATLLNQLSLDGYVFREGTLFPTGDDIVDVDSERNLLVQLFKKLKLKDEEKVFEFFNLSERHFLDSRWSDAIGNTRKFMEEMLAQIAQIFTERNQGTSFDASRPVEVRKQLERLGLIEPHEREAIDKLYALLSHTGSHPYLAEHDQARLLRQISLVIVQFALLRLEGALKPA